MYHRVGLVPAGARYIENYVLPEQFERQLAALIGWGYTPIALEDWLDFRAGHRGLPRQPIGLTFDDGYRSSYDIVWPLLRHYNATATMFLVTDCIGGTNRWDRDELQEPLLNAREIAAMQAGGIHFGSHTCTHRALVDLSVAEALEELTRSRERLEELLRCPVVTLAYPYNKHNARIHSLARGAGYKAAVIGRGRGNARWTSPWALRRVKIDLNTTEEALGVRLKRLKWLTLF
jgi:peptidoglycan/xylan/chitin deacetylase (PgdA/CDA1 family)